MYAYYFVYISFYPMTADVVWENFKWYNTVIMQELVIKFALSWLTHLDFLEVNMNRFVRRWIIFADHSVIENRQRNLRRFDTICLILR